MEERRRLTFQILPQVLLLEGKSQGDGLEDKECDLNSETPKPVSQTFAITLSLFFSSSSLLISPFGSSLQVCFLFFLPSGFLHLLKHATSRGLHVTAS